jgi:hypothetical protein
LEIAQNQFSDGRRNSKIFNMKTMSKKWSHKNETGPLRSLRGGVMFFSLLSLGIIRVREDFYHGFHGWTSRRFLSLPSVPSVVKFFIGCGSRCRGFYLFYRSPLHRRWVCAVSKQEGRTGFLITAYPTDAIKEGERIWPK